MRTFLIIMLFLLSFNAVYSQDKLEREYRIKESAVPGKALEFVESTFPGVRMKWYGEENLNGKAIEAKGTLKGTLYSVEFDTTGALQDIELVISFRAIPEAVRLNVEKNLSSRFSKFRVQKTQQQWLGKPDVLRALVTGQENPGEFTTNYEITLRGTRDGRTDYYEILADQGGKILRESKIVQRSNQHLIY